MIDVLLSFPKMKAIFSDILFLFLSKGEKCVQRRFIVFQQTSYWQKRINHKMAFYRIAVVLPQKRELIRVHLFLPPPKNSLDSCGQLINDQFLLKV